MPDLSFKVWKVQQYCYFWIASEVVTAQEIAAVVGIEPDEVGVRRSRSMTPRVIPVEHSWKIKCTRPGRIDEQVTEVLDRIGPAAHAVRQLLDRADVQAGLMMVRYFDDEDGSYDAMGWRLPPEQISLLASMGAGIQADEYLDNAESSTYFDEPGPR